MLSFYQRRVSYQVVGKRKWFRGGTAGSISEPVLIYWNPGPALSQKNSHAQASQGKRLIQGPEWRPISTLGLNAVRHEALSWVGGGDLRSSD